MSEASADYNISLDVGKEKSLLWLGTHFYNSIPFNIDNMNVDVIWKSPAVKFKYVNILMEFQFSRVSELEFRLVCLQNRSTSNGYTLRFHSTINIFYENPKVFQMQSNEFMVFEIFRLDAAYREHFPPNELKKNFQMKISIEMIEYNCSTNATHRKHEDDFQLMKMHHFNYEPVLTNLCYILNIPRLKDIHTGRQNHSFFLSKSVYIKRTATFAKEIADYLKAKEACISVPLTDLGVILNFILKDERTSINNMGLLSVYFQAYYLGLNFLVILSRELILGRIEDPTFVTDALMAADRVNDEFLFDKVAEKFHYFEQNMKDPEEWLETFRSKNIESQFAAYSLRRRLKKIESAGREIVAESSASERNRFIFL